MHPLLTARDWARASRSTRFPPEASQPEDTGYCIRWWSATGIVGRTRPAAARRHGPKPTRVQRRRGEGQNDPRTTSSSSLDFDRRRIESLPLPRVPRGHHESTASRARGQTPPTQAGWTVAGQAAAEAVTYIGGRAVRPSTDAQNREARGKRGAHGRRPAMYTLQAKPSNPDGYTSPPIAAVKLGSSMTAQY